MVFKILVQEDHPSVSGTLH